MLDLEYWNVMVLPKLVISFISWFILWIKLLHPPLPIKGPWTLAQQYLSPLDIRLLAAFDKGSQYLIQQSNADASSLEYPVQFLVMQGFF